LRISPRGDRLAFREYTGNRRAVVTLDSERKSQTLSSNWLFASGLAWSPSGDEVWFSASETGWAYPIYAVSLSGKLRTVARVPGRLYVQDISRDGSVVVAHQ